MGLDFGVCVELTATKVRGLHEHNRHVIDMSTAHEKVMAFRQLQVEDPQRPQID